MSLDKAVSPACTGGLDIAIETILIATILLSPIALGSVALWARSLLLSIGLLLLNLWLLRSIFEGRIHILNNPAWLFMALFFVLAFVQILPLSFPSLRLLSPAAWRTYSEALGGDFSSDGVGTLSLSPYYTFGEMTRLAALGLFFFILVNSVRKRWQVQGLVLALVAVSTFEALYGFAEQFSGHKHIFWLARQHHLDAVCGTFHNKNHFAGLLEMTIPLTLGLLVAVDRQRARVASARASVIGKQITLALATIIMIVAVFFSLSRAGIVCAVASIGAFLLIAATHARFRGYVLAVLGIGATVATLVAAIGTDYVISAVADAASGQSASLVDRLVLAGAALALFLDYPVFGTGLGTFGTVFGAYQPPHFADAWVNFLHNDWLQIFCETGLVGGTLVVAGTFLVIFTLVRSIRKQTDPFLRWTAMGALLGSASMLLHSFADYNLSRITSNGVIFAAVMGIGIAAANMKEEPEDCVRDCWRFRLDPLPLRIAVIVIALVVSILACPALIKSAVADISFNKYLALETGQTEDYFFLPLGMAEPKDRDFRAEHLMQAVTNQPRNPEYRYRRAIYFLRCANDLLRLESERCAIGILGSESKGSPEFERIAAALAENLRPLMTEERRAYLVAALDDIARAVESAPTEAHYHIQCANLLTEMGEHEKARRKVETALLFAPAKPDVLFDSARILLAGTNESSRVDTETISSAYDYLRSTLYADPSYAKQAYALVLSSDNRFSGLFSVTPTTLKAYEALYWTFWNSGQWDAALQCLDMLDTLAKRRESRGVHLGLPDIEIAAQVASAGEPIKGAAAYDPRTPLQIKTSTARRRATIMGILGRWNRRAEAAVLYRVYMRKETEALRLEAQRLRRLGRNREAAAIYLNILTRDWSDPQTLLDFAEIASLPGTADFMPPWNGSLDHLYRLVINNPELSPDSYDRAIRLMERVSTNAPYEKVTSGFIRGAGAILSGRIDEGVSALEALASRDVEADTWRQRHLIWYYLGLGLEKQGRTSKARSAYQNALKIVPTHRASLLRLVELSKSEADSLQEQLATLTPEVPCEVNFGGKLTLLGYSLSKETRPIRVGGVKLEKEDWFITYYWQFNDRMHGGYRPVIHFCDEQSNTIFHDNHRFTVDDRHYPQDFPRCGEVVVEKRPLRGDPEAASYLRIAVRTDAPPLYLEKNLVHDLGKAGPVQFALELTPELRTGKLLARK